MGDDTEPRFDLIDPRRSDRGEVEMHVRVLLQPCLNIGRGVGGKIVQHDMNFLAGVRLDSLLEKGQEFRAIMGWSAFTENLSGRDIQRGEQVGGAMPDVVVGAFLAGVELDRQQWLGAVQRLDLRLLVQAEHDRSAGRIKVQADDVGDLLCEGRILADFERALPVWLQPVVPPQFRHIVEGHPDTRGAGDELGHLPARPMRQARLRRRRRTGQGEDPTSNFCRHLLPRCSAGAVKKPVDPLGLVARQPQIHRRP